MNEEYENKLEEVMDFVEAEGMIEDRFDFSGVSDKFMDNAVLEHEIDAKEYVETSISDFAGGDIETLGNLLKNEDELKEVVDKSMDAYMKNEFTKDMDSYVNDVNLQDANEVSDAGQALKTGFVSDEAVSNLADGLSEDIGYAFAEGTAEVIDTLGDNYSTNESVENLENFISENTSDFNFEGDTFTLDSDGFIHAPDDNSDNTFIGYDNLSSFSTQLDINENNVDELRDAILSMNDTGVNERMSAQIDSAKESMYEIEKDLTEEMSSEKRDVYIEAGVESAVNDAEKEIEREIKDAIEDSFDMDGHTFDNQTEFHEAVMEDFGLENADLINEVNDYGLEEVIQSQVDAFELSHLSDSLQAEVADYTTNSEILETLAESDDRYVQNNVAGNENTTEETLINLAENTEYYEVLETLANRDEVSEELKQAIVENPNVTDETIENMDKAAMLENDFQALNVNDQVDIATDGQFNNDNDKQTESGSMKM